MLTASGDLTIVVFQHKGKDTDFTNRIITVQGCDEIPKGNFETIEILLSF